MAARQTACRGQRNNLRVRRALPWLAATAFANTIWMAFASSVSTAPWTVPTLVFMDITAWAAYFRLGIPQGEAASTAEKWMQAALRVYLGWLSVATVANTASALIVLGWDGWGAYPPGRIRVCRRCGFETIKKGNSRESCQADRFGWPARHDWQPCKTAAVTGNASGTANDPSELQALLTTGVKDVKAKSCCHWHGSNLFPWRDG
jgi:hypothetical protein